MQFGVALALVLLSALPSLASAQTLDITPHENGVVRVIATGFTTNLIECGTENRYDSDVAGASTRHANCRTGGVRGTRFTLTATPNLHYRFVGWLGDCTGSTAELTITLNNPHRCQAVFAKPDGYVQIDVSAGANEFRLEHACAVTNLSRIHCWGAGASGQIGDGMSTNRDTPTAVSGITNAIAVSTGGLHTCAVLTDGGMRCWGRNNQGQLGDGTMGTNRSIPTTVTGINNAITVSAGQNHTCAVLVNGQVRCWGNNNTTKLGIATGSNHSTPVTILVSGNAVAVATGRGHSCAMLENGIVQCWGAAGILGDGTSSSSVTPSTVSGIANAIAISADSENTCAVLTDGQVRCWGNRKAGRLGNGATSGFALSPEAVTGLNTAVAIAIGNAHTCAVLRDGQAKCWGASGANNRNRDGNDAAQARLGTGNRGGSTTSVDVADLQSVASIAAGRLTSCALLRNGLAYCWGSDADGAIGNGSATTATGYTSPQLVANQVFTQSAIRALAVRDAPFTFQPKVEDSADTITWSLTSSIPAGLRISTRTGIIYGTPQEAAAEASFFDIPRETASETRLRLNRDTDASTSPGNFALTIAVVSPSVADRFMIHNFGTAPITIPENSTTGTRVRIIGLRIAGGDDFGFDPRYAEWSTVNNTTPFQITPQGRVQVRTATLDYETAANFTLTVQAVLPTIGRTLPAFPLPISVTNVVESITPTDTSPSNNTIRSNAVEDEPVAGLRLAAIEGTVPITSGLVWTLTGSDAFRIDQSGVVRASASFNLSTGTSVNLTIVSSQSSIISTPLTVGVMVTNAINLLRLHIKLFLEGPLQ